MNLSFTRSKPFAHLTSGGVTLLNSRFKEEATYAVCLTTLSTVILLPTDARPLKVKQVHPHGSSILTECGHEVSLPYPDPLWASISTVYVQPRAAYDPRLPIYAQGLDAIGGD
jgi:hypothetical protein